MTSPEAEVRVNPGNLFPEEIAARAIVLWNQRKNGERAGGAVSKHVAVALVMQEEGGKIVRGLLERGRIQEHNSSLNDVWRFMYGVGAIVLGGLLRSLEESVLEGWDDRRFAENINEAFLETGISGFDMSLDSEVPSVNQTERIKDALLKDKDRTFLTFLRFPSNFEVLPPSAMKLFEKFASNFSVAVLVYEQAIDQPGIKNSQ